MQSKAVGSRHKGQFLWMYWGERTLFQIPCSVVSETPLSIIRRVRELLGDNDIIRIRWTSSLVHLLGSHLVLKSNNHPGTQIESWAKAIYTLRNGQGKTIIHNSSFSCDKSCTWNWLQELLDNSNRGCEMQGGWVMQVELIFICLFFPNINSLVV